MSEESQLNRIERKLDTALQRTAKHSSDIAWIKSIFAGVGGLFTLAIGHLLRKAGF